MSVRLPFGIVPHSSERVAEFVEPPLRNFANEKRALVAAVGLEPTTYGL